MPKCFALIIGNVSYQDKILSRLKIPEADLYDLASVLRDPAIGNFNLVETVINQPSPEIRRQIRDLFNWKKRHEVLLLYVLGHAVLDTTRQLYLATVDTIYDSLEDTAISAADITEWMDRSFSRQQILILDCYHSVAQGTSRGPGSGVGIAAAFRGKGHRRVVLTASDATHYVLAGDKAVGDPEDSVFTHFLIRGLRKGVADADEDGQIGVGELYEYIDHQVAQHSVSQKPRKWTYHEQDEFIIAHNPSKVKQEHSIKWDLIVGAIMTPTITVVIGGFSDLRGSVVMAGFFLLLYSLLYRALD